MVFRGWGWFSGVGDGFRELVMIFRRGVQVTRNQREADQFLDSQECSGTPAGQTRLSEISPQRKS